MEAKSESLQDTFDLQLESTERSSEFFFQWRQDWNKTDIHRVADD